MISLLILSKKPVNLLDRVVSVLKKTFVLHSVFLPTALHNAMVHTGQILRPWQGLLSLPFCHHHIILDTTLKKIFISELSYYIPIYKILLTKLNSF